MHLDRDKDLAKLVNELIEEKKKNPKQSFKGNKWGFKISSLRTKFNIVRNNIANEFNQPAVNTMGDFITENISQKMEKSISFKNNNKYTGVLQEGLTSYKVEETLIPFVDGMQLHGEGYGKGTDPVAGDKIDCYVSVVTIPGQDNPSVFAHKFSKLVEKYQKPTQKSDNKPAAEMSRVDRFFHKWIMKKSDITPEEKFLGLSPLQGEGENLSVIMVSTNEVLDLFIAENDKAKKAAKDGQITGGKQIQLLQEAVKTAIGLDEEFDEGTVALFTREYIIIGEPVTVQEGAELEQELEEAFE